MSEASGASAKQKLQILVLHGSRQDGEVFSQRLKTLVKKLKDIADLHFVSSPHTLPLQDGQSTPMRAWWRHWNIGTDESPAQQEQDQQKANGSSTSTAAPSGSHNQQQQQQPVAAHASVPAPATSPFASQAAVNAAGQQEPPTGDEPLPEPLVQQLQRQPSLLHGQARQEEISSMMAAGWEAVVLRDWAVSLQHLTDVWSSNQQEFDGVLGFSNGAAAAFLFAAHAAAHPETFGSLRFVALAGGYVPEPLEKLLHHSLLAAGADGNTATVSSSSSSSVQPVSRLKAPLPFSSLHMMGSNDPLIDVDVASQLMDCFQEQGRVQLVHDSGHCVPQQARFMQDILKFIVSFADIPVAPARPHHPRRQPRAPPHAPAAAGVEAGVAEIQAKLHRQGLREKVSKGPAKKHLSIHVDPSGQPHQHLMSPRASSLNRQRSSQLGSPVAEHLQQQQQQSPAPAATAAAACASSADAANAAGALAHTSASAGAGDAVSFGEATDMQLEELEALQAIFGSEYSLVSSCPPTCVIKLREAGAVDDDDGSTEQQQGPPSALFSLRFKLPQGYPESCGSHPLIQVEGPLSTHDPARTALSSHLSAVAAAQQQELGGSGGYIWQLVEAAREWIDEHIPADIATRKAGQLASSGAHSAAPVSSSTLAATSAAGAAAAATAAGAAAAAGGSSGSNGSSSGVPWWEREDVDLQLVAKATAEALAAHWASWSVSQEDSPWGPDADAAAAAGSSSSSGAEALASVGDGVRGRWDYIIGLVGKPSAGKSTFFNAVVDPVDEEDAAQEGAYPFTTITPNVGRGYIALPDPSPLLGLNPDQVQPAYGFARGLDISRVQQAGFSNIGPLLQLVKDCGWQQQGQQQGQMQQQERQQGQQPLVGAGSSSGSSSSGDGVLWRRVPVVIKDVAGLVPGAYQGRGRGNSFLSDLCDADVLVHVVDASGTTDSKGVNMAAAATADTDSVDPQQQGQQQGQQQTSSADAAGEDPTEEVSWVRRELHCWVFDNVRAKWSSVLRRPSRLASLFSGYHAPVGLVHAVMRAVGVRPEDLAAETAAMGNAGLGGAKEVGGPLGSSSLAAWGEWELHRLVAHFLAARFPILLALNKADLPSAQHHIRSVLAAYPHHAAVAVSAAAERKLHLMRRQGLLKYEDAASSAQLAPSQKTAACATDAAHAAASGTAAAAAAAAAAVATLQHIQRSVLDVYATTGVLAALTCAVALKPPRWVFPIADRDKCTALTAAGARAGGSSGSSGSSSNKGGSSGSRHGGSGASSLNWGVDAKARAAQGGETGVLRDCVLLKPGSRVEDVFWVLKRPPYSLLEGDFVRAECRVLSQSSTQPTGQPQMRVVRKDELVGPGNAVLLLQTNRKVSWQSRHG